MRMEDELAKYEDEKEEKLNEIQDILGPETEYEDAVEVFDWLAYNQLAELTGQALKNKILEFLQK